MVTQHALRSFAAVVLATLAFAIPSYGQGKAAPPLAGASEVKWDDYTFKFLTGPQMAQAQVFEGGKIVGTLMVVNGELQVFPTVVGAEADRLRASVADYKKAQSRSGNNPGSAVATPSTTQPVAGGNNSFESEGFVFNKINANTFQVIGPDGKPVGAVSMGNVYTLPDLSDKVKHAWESRPKDGGSGPTVAAVASANMAETSSLGNSGNVPAIGGGSGGDKGFRTSDGAVVTFSQAGEHTTRIDVKGAVWKSPYTANMPNPPTKFDVTILYTQGGAGAAVKDALSKSVIPNEDNMNVRGDSVRYSINGGPMIDPALQTGMGVRRRRQANQGNYSSGNAGENAAIDAITEAFKKAAPNLPGNLQTLKQQLRFINTARGSDYNTRTTLE